MANQVWNRLSQMTSNYKNSQQAPSLNNNQYSSYYSKLYPGLNEESYNKMVNAVDSLGLTGENRTNAMNNYYRTHVKTLINDQTLQERDGIINQQAYEAAKLNNKDADAELRMTEAVQKAKKLWNLDATANDREVFSTMVETLGADGVKLAGQYLSGENDELLYKAGLEQREAKKPIEVTGGDIWDNIRTKANVPIDTMKKWGQRTFDKMGALLYKNVLKNTLGDAVDGKLGDMDSYVQFFAEKNIEPRLRENALNYQQGINERYQSLEQKNLDQDIKNYYDNKGYTELIGEGDLKGFMYKSLGDAAQNREMPVVVAASVVQPEIGLALMATDSYARENQEAFENMLNNGATYEQAENGAVVVGLINSAVEVCLEKLIGGVETGASDAIRKTFMKNVQEEATKKGLGRILLEGVGTQLRASGEEGLEEIVQQIVQNAAVKTVNENQELFEGVGQAFEGGFYNPMNLLAGGGNLTQNISQNTDTINQQLGDTAYNAGVMTRKTVDGFTDVGSFMKDKATAIKQMAKERLNRKNGQNVTTENVESETVKENKSGVIDRITDWGAEKITNTVSAQDKLYKAQEPRMNVLSKKKDIEKRREHSDRANQLIVQNGYIPTNTAERLEAHENTMKNIWNQVEDKINGGQEIMVDLSQIADVLDEYIQSQRDTKSTLTEGDLAKLEKESQALRGQQVSLPVAERLKQLYNAVINNRGEEKASDTMANGLQKATHAIGVIEDNLLSEIPGEFQGLKNDFGALKDTYEDVFKADMKNQRKKGSGLTETYSRIEGFGDIANGLLGVATGKGDMASIGKGAAKFLVGKSLAKASDVDFLIEQGFKELAKQYGNNGNVTTNTTPTTPTATEGVDQQVTTTPKKKTTKKKTSKKSENKTEAIDKNTQEKIDAYEKEINEIVKPYRMADNSVNLSDFMKDKKAYSKYTKIMDEIRKLQGYMTEDGMYTQKRYDMLNERKERVYGKQKSTWADDEGLDKNQVSSKTATDMQKTKLNTNTDTSDMVKVSKTNTEGNEIANATKGKSNFVDFNDIDLNNKKEYVWEYANDYMKEKMQYHDITHYTNDKLSMLDKALKSKKYSKGVGPEDFKASYTLGEILDNPELYKKYPSLKDKEVMFVDFHTNRARGLNMGGTIFINSKYYAKDPGLGNSTIVHEIEHEIQKLNGEYVDDEFDTYTYKANPNEIGARNKQKQYLEFIGRGDEKMRWE